MNDFLERYRKAALKLGLVFMIGWSFVNAVQLAQRLLDDDDDDGHDHPKEVPEPPPDDGHKRTITVDYSDLWDTVKSIEHTAATKVGEITKTMPR